jgi:ankyrin repeat protein
MHSCEPNPLVIKQMIQAGLDVKQRDSYERDALFWAIDRPHTTPEVLKVLFEAGSENDFTNNLGNNAFFLQRNDREHKDNALAVAECLHDHGVDINAVNVFRRTPVFVRIKLGCFCPELIEKYFQLGADPNVVDFESKNLLGSVNEYFSDSESESDGD